MARVAHVVVDLDVAHLDRPFDYSIPDRLRKEAKLGSLVRVKWGEQRVNGWIVGLSDSSQHKLKPLLSVSSSVPLFTEQMLETYRYIAVRYAATLSQVLSVSIPKRRASAEKNLPASTPGEPLFPTASPVTQTYPSAQLRSDSRIVATAVPHLALTALMGFLSWASARKVQVQLVVPTTAAAERLHSLIASAAGDSCALQTPDLPQALRYENHLRALRGDFQVVVGTLSAAWIPAPGDAITVIWDEANDLSRSRRTPGVDALDIAVARSLHEGHGVVCFSYARSVKAQALVQSGWAQEVEPRPDIIRANRPLVSIIGPEQFEKEGATALLSLPDSAFRLIRDKVQQKPVLVQVPAPGRTLEIESGPVLVGAERVAKDLGKAFPGIRVTASSSSSRILREVSSSPQIVVATPGAEPQVPGGYGTVIVTEAHLLAYADRLNAEEDALRQWFSAFALAEPRATCVLSGAVPEVLARALTLWNPLIAVRKLLQEREEIGFFPSRWMVALDGDSTAVEQITSALLEAPLDPPAEMVGTVELEQDEEGALFSALRVRSIIAVQPSQAMELMTSLRSIRIARSLDRRPQVHVTVNPAELF